MYLDASAMTAIIAREDDCMELSMKIEGASVRITSALSVYEAVLAIARLSDGNIETACEIVTEFLEKGECRVVAVDDAVGAEALAAFARFGKGRHKAGLNMGDCFAYACAKVHGVPLLCKGNDFIHTGFQIA